MVANRIYRRVFRGPDSNDSPNLDFLRAVAVSCVLLSHCAAALGYYELGSLGRFGVVLFFVHTSFVLMASLDRTAGDAVAFMIRRFFRIYPLAVFFILLVPLFHIPVGPGLAYSWIGTKFFIANLALAQNVFYAPSILGPLWSLPLEVQMYCFLPALYAVARKGFRWALAMWVVSVPLAVIIPRISGRADVFSYAPCFASGILGYSLARLSARIRLPALGFIAAIIGSIFVFRPFDDMPLTSKLPLAWSLSLVIGLAIPFTRELTSRSLHKVTHLIARYSYGVYLTHIVVLWLVADEMKGIALGVRIAVFLAGIVGVPIVLFHAIEDPMIRVGRAMSRRVAQRNAVAPAVYKPKSLSQAV